MQEAPIPDDEAKRLALLKACKIIYTPAEEAFDDIARLAAELCGAEIALITLVDADYQWFKARVGVEQTGTPRDLSFCGHCINHHHPLIVEDTHKDPRFADNPLVTGDPFIRFYAGVPLEVEDGSAVGAISVADRAPRTLSDKQLDSLRRLAKQIARELRLRRDLDRVGSPVTGGDLPIASGALVAGKYRVTRPLGRGGTGAVFEAVDERGGRVAIKVLLPLWRTDEGVVERFAREARVLLRLSTPHVARLLEVGNLDATHGALPFLVLEYLEGADLSRVLEARKRVGIDEAFAWGIEACDGVAAAHDLGVVHRDLKPSNLFLAEQGEAKPTVKVLDFGIAAGDPMGIKSQITNSGATIGSPAYMAPEQMMSASDVDARTDVWSMGVLLYKLVAGELPFRGPSDLQLFANALTKAPLPLRAHLGTAASKRAEAVLQKCLRRSREDRFSSMRELADALRDSISPP